MTTIYHVTPYSNEDSILKTGIDPSYSRGAQFRSWFVEMEMLTWALAHVSTRYGVPVNNLIVCQVDMPLELMLKTRWAHVYQSKFVIPPTVTHHPRVFLDNMLELAPE